MLSNHDFNSIVKNNIEEMSFKYKFKPEVFLLVFLILWEEVVFAALCVFQTLRFNDYSL